MMNHIIWHTSYSENCQPHFKLVPGLRRYFSRENSKHSYDYLLRLLI